MPIFALIGGAAVILFLVQGDHPANAIIGSYDQLTSNDLPAIPAVHARRIPARRRQGLGSSSSFLSSVLRLGPWRYGCRDGGVVRILHAADGRIGRHHPCARRIAAAGAPCRRLQRALLARPADRGRVAGPALPAVAAPHPVRHRRRGPDRGPVRRRSAAGHVDARRACRAGRPRRHGDGQRAPRVHASRSGRRYMGGEVGAAAPGRHHRVASRRRHDGAIGGAGGALHARRAAVHPARSRGLRRSAPRDEPLDCPRRRHPHHPGGRRGIYDVPDRRAGAGPARGLGAARTSTRSGCSCSG